MTLTPTSTSRHTHALTSQGIRSRHRLYVACRVLSLSSHRRVAFSASVTRFVRMERSRRGSRLLLATSRPALKLMFPSRSRCRHFMLSDRQNGSLSFATQPLDLQVMSAALSFGARYVISPLHDETFQGRVATDIESMGHGECRE